MPVKPPCVQALLQRGLLHVVAMVEEVHFVERLVGAAPRGVQLVDGAIGRYLNDAVTNRIDKFVVVGAHQDVAREVGQRVVKSLNGLQVEVVSGVIQQHHIGVAQHHACNHTAHFLASGEHVYPLVDVLARKEHLAQVAPQESLAGIGRVHTEPFYQSLLAFEKAAVFHRRISRGNGYAPGVMPIIGFQFPAQNLKKCGGDQGIARKENHFFVFFHRKGYILQQLRAVFPLFTQARYI